MPEIVIPTVAHSVEVAFGSLKSAVLILGRSATGNRELMNQKRALKEIKEVRKHLDALEAATILAMTSQRDEDRAAKRAKGAADRAALRYVAKHPDQRERAIKLGMIPPDPQPVEDIVVSPVTVIRPGFLFWKGKPKDQPKKVAA